MGREGIVGAGMGDGGGKPASVSPKFTLLCSASLCLQLGSGLSLHLYVLYCIRVGPTKNIKSSKGLDARARG